MEISREMVPRIFQVRSSFASFFRSSFSSRSDLNFSEETFEGFSLGSAFFGFSASGLGVDFFSLLAIKTKIMIRLMKCRRDAALTKKNDYFFRRASRSMTHPRMNSNPPTGVMIPTAEGTTLFMAFNDAMRYRDPENKTTPPIKKNPA